MYTSKSRASRLAEVSNYKKCAAIGSRKQVLPIGAATKLHTASQLCSLSSTSFCLIPFQLRSPLFSSSQTISALLNFCNSFQQLSKLFHLSPPHLNSFHLFLALLNSPQWLPSSLVSTRPNSLHLLPRPQLFPSLLSSDQLFSPLSQFVSQGISSSQLWPALLNSCHLLSQRQWDAYRGQLNWFLFGYHLRVMF